MSKWIAEFDLEDGCPCPNHTKEASMSDLISRQAAINVLEKILPANPLKSEYTQGITCGAALAIEYVKQLPSVQPKIGRWILTDVEGNRVWHCKCSECKKDPQDYIGGSEDWWLIKNKLPKYCPNCGAKMQEAGKT